MYSTPHTHRTEHIHFIAGWMVHLGKVDAVTFGDVLVRLVCFVRTRAQMFMDSDSCCWLAPRTHCRNLSSSVLHHKRTHTESRARRANNKTVYQSACTVTSTSRLRSEFEPSFMTYAALRLADYALSARELAATTRLFGSALAWLTKFMSRSI